MSGEAEGAALAELAFHPDLPTHHVHQTFADGQSQSGAAVFAGGGGIGLSEGLKKVFHLLICEPDAGVTHRELQRYLVFFSFYLFC